MIEVKLSKFPVLVLDPEADARIEKLMASQVKPRIKHSVHYSSATEEWSTPQDFFDRLNAEFHFDLDVCATKENAKCPRYYTKEDDALTKQWTGRVWMNPPYGRTIGKWMDKFTREYAFGRSEVSVALVPARTDTKWWHGLVQPILNGECPGDVRFIRGRLKFGGHKNSAPFPSAVVVYDHVWRFKRL